MVYSFLAIATGIPMDAVFEGKPEDKEVEEFAQKLLKKPVKEKSPGSWDNCTAPRDRDDDEDDGDDN